MRRILFVDDEAPILEALRHRFRDRKPDWDVAFAQSGEEALRKLDDARFDVVVTDLRMPIMDGTTLLTRVQQQHPDVIRVLSSGHVDAESTLNAIFVAHQFVPKPVDSETLENVVERACELRAAIQSEAVRKIIGRIDTLPSAPGIYCTLSSALANPNVAVSEVARLLEQDAALCTKILQLVNSALFRSSRDITNVETAVAHLGFETVRTLVLAVEIFQTTDSRVSGQTIDSLQRHALRTAVIAENLVEDKRLAQSAFTGGMLHDIGKLLLASELPSQICEALDTARALEQPLHEVERVRNGVTHAEIGASLLGLWGLPYPIVEAVANHHSPERVPQRGFDVLGAVYVANCLAHEQDRDPAWEGAKPRLDQDYLARLGVEHQLGAWREMAAAVAEFHG